MKAMMEYEDMVDVFYQGYEDNQDVDQLADRVVASTGLKMEYVLKAQEDACNIFSRNAYP